MNAGLPIVATATRGIADHLVEGSNALFISPRDPAALARALERLLSEPALRAQMGNANREAVKAFAPDLVAAGYLSALDAVRAG